MSRYIDADKLDELIAQLNREGRNITRNEYKMIDNILYEFPTADVAEIKRGRWIRHGKDDNRCSICGWGVWVNTGNYCPNCGAKMEEDDDHHD